MKKLTKILIIALTLALLCGAFVFSASATDDAPAATTEKAFEVTDADGELVGEYVTVVEAFTSVPNGGTITMMADYEDGTNTTQVSLAAGKEITFDLNGYTFAASYCTKNNDDGTEGVLYQKFNVYGSITVVGEGTIVSATSLFNILSGGSVTFDSGDDTIYLVAIHGYNKDTGALASSARNFPGGHFIKVNTNAVSTGIATLNVYGNLDFVDETGKTNLCLFAYSDGSLINIEDATINSTNNGANGGIFTNHFSGTYDKETYDAPVINITNSVINAPYGTFFNADNKATDYSDAPVVTIEGSTLNLVGDEFPVAGEGAKSAVFNMADKNVPLKVVMTDTKVYTDSNLFCGKSADEVPLATIQLNGCTISIDTAAKCDNGDAFNWSNTYSYRRYAFYGVVTAVVEDTAIVHEGVVYISNIIINTHAWADKATAEDAGKVDPGYFGELGGMGVIFKAGTSFIDCRSDALATAAAAGTYSTAFAGYALEAGKAVVSQIAWLDGAPCSAKVVAAEGGGYEAILVDSVQSATTGSYTDGTQVNGSFGLINTSSMKDRNGKYTICEYEGNKYITHEAQEGTNKYKTDPFMPFNFNAGSAGAYNHAIDTARFYSFEFDVAPADLAHSRGSFTAAFLFRPSTQYINVALSTDATGKMVWKIGNKLIANASVEAGVWQHVQIIIEAPVVDGAFDTANAANFNIHLCVDGEIIGSATLEEANSTLAAAIAETTDFKTVAITELRFKFPSSYYADDTGSTAFDNFILSRFPIDYTGGKETDEDILNSAVNKSYVLSENLPLFKVGNNYYNKVEDAFKRIGNLARGENVPTLEFLMNVPGVVFDPLAYRRTETAAFRFATGGAGITLAPNCGYVAVDEGNGTYLVRPATEEDKVTITWYDSYGSEIKTEEALPGAAVSHPVIDEPWVDENDYYKATYNAWSIDGQILTGDTYTVADKDVEIYLAANVEPTFKDVFFNVGLNDNMVYQFILPHNFVNNEVWDVTLDEVKLGGSKKTAASKLTIGDKDYALFNQYSGYANFASNTTCEVTYTVTVDGIEYTFTRTFTVSPLSYVGYILDSEDYNADEKNHVANLLRFGNEFVRAYNNGIYNPNINAVYEAHKDICSAYEDELLNETEADLGELTDYLSAAFVNIASGRAQFAFQFKEDSNVKNIVITQNDGKYVVPTYATSNKYHPLKDEAGNIVYKVDESGNQVLVNGQPVIVYTEYYAEYYTANLRFYDFFKELNITFTLADGTTVTGTYDANTWYNGATFASEEQKAMWGDFLKALKELGDSFYTYRFQPETGIEGTYYFDSVYGDELYVKFDTFFAYFYDAEGELMAKNSYTVSANTIVFYTFDGAIEDWLASATLENGKIVALNYNGNSYAPATHDITGKYMGTDESGNTPISVIVDETNVTVIFVNPMSGEETTVVYTYAIGAFGNVVLYDAEGAEVNSLMADLAISNKKLSSATYNGTEYSLKAISLKGNYVDADGILTVAIDGDGNVVMTYNHPLRGPSTATYTYVINSKDSVSLYNAEGVEVTPMEAGLTIANGVVTAVNYGGFPFEVTRVVPSYVGKYTISNGWNEFEMDVAEETITFYIGWGATVYDYVEENGAIVLYANGQPLNPMLASVTLTDGAITAVTNNGWDYTATKAGAEEDEEIVAGEYYNGSFWMEVPGTYEVSDSYWFTPLQSGTHVFYVPAGCGFAQGFTELIGYFDNTDPDGDGVTAVEIDLVEGREYEFVLIGGVDASTVGEFEIRYEANLPGAGEGDVNDEEVGGGVGGEIK